MNVNLDYYKIFYYVAKYENFTRAAQALGNSQPNVTRAMNCLEQQINSTLFVRTNRGVQLTQEGKRLYEHVSIAMAQLLEAEEELADNEGIFQGSISIGASETALNIFLLDILKSFHKMYPKVRLKIYNHSTPQAIEAVKSGKIDFAVVSTPVKVKSPLEKTILCSFKEILIGGTDFEHIKDDNISLKNLKDYPLISLGQETTTYDFYNKIFYSLMVFLGIFLPLCTYLSYINSTILVIFLAIIEILICIALINKVNKSYLKFFCYNNKLKFRNGIFSTYSLVQCDKVAIVHTNKSNENLEIIIITSIRSKNKKLKLISKDFINKNKEVADEYIRIKKIRNDAAYYFQVINCGELNKYILLDNIYKNCVNAIYTSSAIESIKIARGQKEI